MSEGGRVVRSIGMCWEAIIAEDAFGLSEVKELESGRREAM